MWIISPVFARKWEYPDEVLRLTLVPASWTSLSLSTGWAVPYVSRMLHLTDTELIIHIGFRPLWLHRLLDQTGQPPMWIISSVLPGQWEYPVEVSSNARR